MKKITLVLITATFLAGCEGEWTPDASFQIPRPDLWTTVGTSSST